MPVSRVDEALWSQLVEAFREDPGNVKGTARRVGVTPKTAKRAWEKGYPSRGAWGAKPIKQLMQEERELAASKLQHEQDRQELEEDRALLEAERDREAMRQRAIDTRAQEGKLVSASRALISAAFGSAMTLARTEGLTHLLSRLGNSMAALATQDGDLTAKQASDAMILLRRYSTTLRELTEAGRTAMEMERLYLGEPTHVIGVVQDLDTMPLDDLVKLAGYQDGLLQRAANRGLVVLPGGKSAAIDAEAVALLPAKPGAGNQQAG